MKKILFVLVVVLAFSGCAKTIPPPTANDVSIATQQAMVAKACYDAQKAVKPDMSTWTVERIQNYLLIEKLGEANLLLAGKPLDKCAGAGGKNYYDARIAEAAEDTKRAEMWHKTVEGALTKGLYAWGIYEVAGMFKKSGTTYNLSGENNSMNISDIGNTDINTNVGDQLSTSSGMDLTTDDLEVDSPDLIPTIQ